MRRLSGGNQQKVTIARWVAGGVHTMLCFDPTRGIDIRTKQQIYVLLRDLAEAGAAVLLYTSELKEVQLVCDRAIVIFGGRVVAEIPGADADEPALLRAAYNLKSDAVIPELAVAEASPPRTMARRPREPTGVGRARSTGGPGMSAAAAPVASRARVLDVLGPAVRRNAWTLGLLAFLVALLALTRAIQPTYGPIALQGLGTSVLPLALAAVAQAIVVIVRRDRPVDRIDDGAHERHLGIADGGPERGIRRSSSCSACSLSAWSSAPSTAA